MLEGKRLAQAKRCQLMVGSHEEAAKACPCRRAKDCQFSIDERDIFCSHPDVVEAARQNWQEYEINKLFEES